MTPSKVSPHPTRESDARLKLIFEQALDAIITMDQDDRITGWNPQAEHIFGWSSAEALGHRLADTILPAPMRDEYLACVRQLADGSTPAHSRRMELAARHRDGREFPVELTVGSVRAGAETVFSAFARDITEQRLAQERLRASEDRYRAFVSQSTEAIWCCELEEPLPTDIPEEEQIEFIYQHAYMSECNDEMARMYGFTEASQLLGLRMEQLLVRSDPRNLEYLRAFVRSGYRLTDAESHEIDRDGRSKYFLNNFVGILEQGRLRRAWGTQRDITDRREGERRAGVFASLAYQLSGCKVPVEAARIIVDVAQQLCGWESCSLDLYSADIDRIDAVLTIDQVNGRPADIPPAYTGEAPSPMARKVIEEGPQLVLRDFAQPDPAALMPFGDTARKSASLMFVPIRNEKAVIGLLSIQSYKLKAYTPADLTLLQLLGDQCGAALERIRAEQDLRRAEEQLRQAQKMEAVGRLAGGIAHDFNNLLTTILGTSDLLLEELPPGRQWRDDVEEIRRAGDRAAALTRQLLAFSRKQVVESATINVNEIVTGIGRMLQRLIGEDVEMMTRLAPTLGLVRADAGQIEQIILNLAVNSRDAMPGGGKLIIETENIEFEHETLLFPGVSPGKYVMLSIADSGIGMDAETRSHIFEPFFTTKEQGKGTGLGLATVYGIVRQSGGFIGVYSEPGAGAVFKIYLPQVDAPVSTESAPRTQPQGGHETILIAEDEPAVRSLTERVLRTKGYTVLTAASGGEALALVDRYRETIHLLLTDVVMPGMSGPQLAERLLADRQDLKVLFMSGYTAAAIHHHGVLEPGVSYLQKPFSPQSLSEKVREVLDGSGAGRLLTLPEGRA